MFILVIIGFILCFVFWKAILKISVGLIGLVFILFMVFILGLVFHLF